MQPTHDCAVPENMAVIVLQHGQCAQSRVLSYPEKLLCSKWLQLSNRIVHRLVNSVMSAVSGVLTNTLIVTTYNVSRLHTSFLKSPRVSIKCFQYCKTYNQLLYSQKLKQPLVYTMRNVTI